MTMPMAETINRSLQGRNHRARGSRGTKAKKKDVEFATLIDLGPLVQSTKRRFGPIGYIAPAQQKELL